MYLFCENTLNFLSVFTSYIGIYAIIWWCIEHLSSLFEFLIYSIKTYFNGQWNMSLQEKYGQWAVITGATDGIGKYYAIELAKKGMNVCLISRTEAKLNSLAKEIEDVYNVLTKIIVADFEKGESIYEHIELQLQDIDIGILINNVGFHDDPDEFEKASEQALWKMINVNVGAVTFMSRMVIPRMKQKNRGLILNVSSGTQYQPLPLVAVYGASKSYLRSLSIALQRELAGCNVKVHLVIPFFVKTNMTYLALAKQSNNLFFPDAKTYVKSTIKMLGKCAHTSGYWYHSIQFTLFTTLPECIRVILSHQFYEKARQRKLRKVAALQKNN